MMAARLTGLAIGVVSVAALVTYIWVKLNSVEALEDEVENLEQTISVKEEAYEVRTRPVPTAVSDVLDRM
jgi:hypothetical protein